MATSCGNSKCSLASKHVFVQFRRIYILHSENTECLNHFEKKWRFHFSFEITVFMTKSMARYPCIVSCFGCHSKTFSTFLQQEREKKKCSILSHRYFFSFFLSFTRRQKEKKINMMKIKRTNLMNNWTLKRKSRPLKCLLIASSKYGWITFNWCVTSGYQTHERRKKDIPKAKQTFGLNNII